MNTAMSETHSDKSSGNANSWASRGKCGTGAQSNAAADGPPEEVEPARRAVVVIEARQLIRECLVHCLRSASRNEDIIPLASIAEWQDWITHSGYAPGDVLILLNAGGLRGREEDLDQDLSILARLKGEVPIVLISETEDPDHIADAIDKGASGFLPMSVSLSVAVEAMRLVRAGGVYIPASSLLSARRSGDAGGGNARGRYNGLFTSRQAAVVEAIRRGKANKMIAYELQMKESTVKVHVRNIMRKLRAKNRTEVAVLANNCLARRVEA